MTMFPEYKIVRYHPSPTKVQYRLYRRVWFGFFFVWSHHDTFRSKEHAEQYVRDIREDARLKAEQERRTPKSKTVGYM